MAAKDIRNLIIGLIVLLVGINLISRFTEGYISTVSSNPDLNIPELNLSSYVNLFNLGIGFIVIVLIPLYLSARSKEKKGV